MKPVLIAIAALTLVAACNRNEASDVAEAPQAQPQADSQVTPADQAAPLTYSRETAYAEVELTLPQAVIAFPDLHATLYREEVQGMRAFVEGAQSDHTEFSGEESLPPYSQTVTYETAGQSPRLFSLRESISEYTGGAHGMQSFGAVLWDKTGDRRIQPTALFRSGADLAVLDRALCDAINQARSALMDEPSNLTLGATDTFACPSAAQTPFVLATSTTSGRVGGLEFLIGPYQVGPYAEGTYQIVVPQSAFRSLIDPAYAAEFAGAPRRVGDVTDRGDVTPAR